MKAALKLLHTRSIYPGRMDVKFQIRQRVVHVDEVMDYFRRKYDDVERDQEIWAWIAEMEEDPSASLHVSLISENSSHTMDEPSSGSSGSSGTSDVQFTPSQDTNSDEVSPSNPMLLGRASSLSTGIEIRSPDELQVTEQVITFAAAYCIGYFTSPHATNDVEPVYHMHEPHATFGSRIQDGISLVLNFHGDQTIIPEAFRLKFQDFEDLFLRMHPMCLVQILSTTAELLAAGKSSESKGNHKKCEVLEMVAGGILKLLASWAQSHFLQHDNPNSSHPLPLMLSELSNSAGDHRMHLLLKAVERMVGVSTHEAGIEGTVQHWKSLYLQERYADCLYHAGVTGERHELRARLLEDQRLFYGDARRNVLWTVTNVADDNLEKNHPMQAGAMFQFALTQSKVVLKDFDQSKIMFAALEGLAKTEVLTAEMDLKSVRTRESRFGSIQLRRYQAAVEYLQSAEEVSRNWFPPQNRRTIRVRNHRIKLQEIIGRHERGMRPTGSAA